MAKVNEKREQAISVIAKHVNNEHLTSRELAEIVLDLALAQSTNADEFVNSIHELCEEEEECVLRAYHYNLKFNSLEEN